MKNSSKENRMVEIRAYSNKELCHLYDTNRRTLKRWLAPHENEIGRRIGNYFSPKQVVKIFEKLGLPRGNQAVITIAAEKEFVKEQSQNPAVKEKENVADYVDAAWEFAQAVLWSGKSFSNEEMAAVKKFLLEFFTFPCRTKEEVSFKKRLSAFCQRVLITRSYLDFMPDYRFVPNPAVWFDRSFKYGFNGTSKWLKKIQEGRKINPAYREELEVLAGFYQEYVETRSLAVANKAAEYLVKREYPSLIRIFCNCISEINAKHNYSNAA